MGFYLKIASRPSNNLENEGQGHYQGHSSTPSYPTIFVLNIFLFNRDVPSYLAFKIKMGQPVYIYIHIYIYIYHHLYF